jgi:CRISPR-associated endonuclease Csy4
MKFYIEITLLPSVDVGINFLWAKLYQQVHLALVEMSDSKGDLSIGAAFPEYDTDRHSLGSTLRLFAKSESDLDRMDIRKWLNRLLDYVHITQIRKVPNGILSYSIYRRKQPNRSFAKLERLMKRKAKRENTSLEEAKIKIIGSTKNETKDALMLKFPFIEMRSLSSYNRFRLFISQEKSLEFLEGNFNCYGLSNEATVPDF